LTSHSSSSIISLSIRHLPYDHAFGHPPKQTGLTAADCISGGYSVADTKASKTLGRRVPTKGSRLEDFDSDIPAGCRSGHRQKNEASPGNAFSSVGNDYECLTFALMSSGVVSSGK
jgi:hypothetical protein